MKSKKSIIIVPAIFLLLILISSSKSSEANSGIFQTGKTYKLSDKISSTITVKVKEVKEDWILLDPTQTTLTKDDTVVMWINTSRFSVVQVLD